MDIDLKKKIELEHKYFSKIKLLNETVWEHKITRKKIHEWLDNFKDEEEKFLMLFVLTEFIYFNKFQIDTLIISVYRDLYKYRLLREIRKNNNDTLNEELINKLYKSKLSKTRFISLGNPSESSSMFLYKFRTLNNLSKKLFISIEYIEKCQDDIEYFIFIDDFCGSGSQAKEYSKDILPIIKKKYPNSHTSYFVLLSTVDGKNKLRNETSFNHVDSILDIDDSFKCFNNNSRIFQNKDSIIDVAKIKEICGRNGKMLMKLLLNETSNCDISKTEYLAEKHKFGFSDGQLLIGFEHNTPDNTLPLIWFNLENVNWNPIFKRHNKIY